MQLHHGGNRVPEALNNMTPVCPSDDPETGARGLTTEEVEQLRDDFIAAAVRAQTAGYDGVQLHGAHGYVICQFLSSEINHRADHYGGSLENRSRCCSRSWPASVSSAELIFISPFDSPLSASEW